MMVNEPCTMMVNVAILTSYNMSTPDLPDIYTQALSLWPLGLGIY